MIKALYKEDGTITGFWALTETPPTPYIEITEEIHSKIVNQDNYIVKDNEIFDISATPEYIAKISLEENTEKQKQIKAQIENIENQQKRALRELVLNNNDEYSKSKLEEIERQIQGLRIQL